jgi:DNA (cytosine-5)-methyltransferase 1
MKYFSLFSGIGGFELGLIKAYVEITNRDSVRKGKGNKKKNETEGQGLESKTRKGAVVTERQSGELPDWDDDPRAPRCVGYSEIDKYAIQIYEKYFIHKNFGDIRKINAKRLPDFDVLIGGFPCQSFSVAGKRKGFKDTRGTLFFEIARIVAAKRPKLLLLENVKGLLSHQEGRTFGTILSTLDELGYDLQWEVLNSKNFGVPQNRERVFIVGHLRGEPRPKIFSLKSNDRGNSEQHVPQQKTARGVRNMSDLKSRWRHTMRIRKLTPTECERLQGFPDGWTEGVSETQRYKTLGNAVTVNVVAEIAKRLMAEPQPRSFLQPYVQRK